MARSFVSLVKSLIEQRRVPHLTSLMLVFGYVVSRLTSNVKLEQLVLEGMALSLDGTIHREARGKMLLTYAMSHKLSGRTLLAYCRFSRSYTPEAWFDSFPFNEEFHKFGRALALRANGQIDDAIAELSSLRTDNFELRILATKTLTSIFHQRQNHEMVATVLVNLLSVEPDKLLIKYAIGAAASAEAAGREDLFILAATRALDDVERIVSSKSLFRKYWRDASEGSLSLFDIHGALAIARRAEAVGLPAHKSLQHIVALKDDLQPIQHVFEEARRDLLERCETRPRVSRDGDVIVVVPAAAVRVNKMDYPGFRRDIRFCLKAIVSTLDEQGVSYTIRSRIRNHGILSFGRPYFSYHTVGSNALGLHFKETDRQGLFSFDSGGYAGWSNFSHHSMLDAQVRDQPLALCEQFFEADRASLMATRQSKYAQKDSTQPLPASFIFVALQVVGDAVQSLAFMTPYKMLDEVLSVAKIQGLSVVVKRHPACKSAEISKYLDEHAADLVVVDGNIHDIIPASTAVCLVNSGVGAEALLYEKPVYVFGRSDYMQACFVCQREGDFKKAFKAGENRLTPDELKRFWHSYRNIYACNLRNQDAAANWIRGRVLRHLHACGGLSNDQVHTAAV